MKTDLIEHLNKQNVKPSLTKVEVGDTVRVHTRIKEGNKERIQIFEGVVIGLKHGEGVNGTFTVRKISNGVGVERVFPFHSPNVVKIEVKRRSKVRRAKLNYLRELTGKKARLKEVKFDSLIINAEPEKEVIEEAVAAKAEDQKDEVEETEIHTEAQEDEEKVAEESVEEIIKEENKESEEVHKTEEESRDGDDESNLPEEEVEAGTEKAEEEDTRKQEDKS